MRSVLRSQSMTNCAASVDMSRYSSLSLRLGRPKRRPTVVTRRPARGIARRGGTPWVASHMEVNAPRAMKAPWAREIWPVSPNSTLRPAAAMLQAAIHIASLNR